MIEGLRAAFLLDRRWYWMRGELERSKEPDLAALAAILGKHGISYAVIGGVALQIHQREPRTTLDIDIAVCDRDDIPRVALRASGFSEVGRHEHSENWVGPEGTPVQFTDDPALADAVARAIDVPLGGGTLRVLRVVDLLHEKLRDPARRRSKRLQDLADAQSLLEQDPALQEELTAGERALLDELPG
jgi:hypothetical protein